MSADVCYRCEKPENFPADPKSELRPYGPGGVLVCYRCAFVTSESERETAAAFGALLDASVAASPDGIAVIGEGHNRGPDPLDADDLPMTAEQIAWVRAQRESPKEQK